MKLIIPKFLLQVLTLGILGGMRATSAPLITCYLLGRGKPVAGEHKLFGFMRSENVAKVSGLMMLGEFIGDKLPTTPDRIIPGALAGRAISGAIAGAGISHLNDESVAKGALIGAAAATAATFGSFYLRKTVVKHTHIADPIVGAMEDALLITAGLLLIRSIK